MKNFIVMPVIALFFTLCGLAAQADMTASNLAGNWASACAQSQMNGKQGFTIEVYAFDTSNHYTFIRHWFKDSSCQTSAYGDDSESGTIKVGSENTNHGFNPANTYEVAYTNNTGTDLGLIWLDSSSNKMRISRGFGSGQNTMLSMFQYSKLK